MFSRIFATLLFCFTLTFTASAALWSGAKGDPNGWKTVDWFGTFWSPDEGAGWLYHEELGWLYAQGESQSDINFYTEGLEWFYSGEDNFPSLYLYELERWVTYNDYDGFTSYPLKYYDQTYGLYVSRDSLAFEIAPANPLGDDYTLQKSFVVIRHGQRFPESDFTNGIQYTHSQLGELTQVGEQEELNLGRIFASKLASLNLTTDNVFLTADLIPRTEESARYFAVGLGLYDDPSDVTLLTDFNEDIFSGKENDCTDEIEARIPRTTSWRDADEAFISQYQPQWQKAAGESLSFGDMYDLADYLQFNVITNRALPEGFTVEDINIIWDYANFQNLSVAGIPYYSWKEIEYMFGSIYYGIKGEDIYTQPSAGKKFFLFGGHDGTLVPMMGALVNPQQDNPIFASFLQISVYTKASDNSDYVYASYNGQAVDLSRIPGGANPCPKDIFLDYISKGPTSPCD